MSWLTAIGASILSITLSFFGAIGLLHSTPQTPSSSGSSATAQEIVSSTNQTNQEFISTFVPWVPVESVHWDKYPYVQNGKVYCFTGQGTFEPITKADPSSFLVATGTVLAKDKNSVYSNCSAIPGADPFTFMALDNRTLLLHDFGLDKDHVYDSNRLLKNVDPYSFSLVTQGWNISLVYFKDKTRVYFEGVDRGNHKIVQTLSDSDPLTFVQLLKESAPGGYDLLMGKDKNHVYFNGDISPNLDAATFVQMGAFLKDKNHVYQITETLDALTIVKNADPATFSVVDCNSGGVSFGQDKNHIFDIAGKIISKIDCPK